MFISLGVLAILFKDGSQSEMNVIQIDRIGIILHKTFEQISCSVLLTFCRTQCDIITRPHPIPGIIDRHHLQSLLKFDQCRTVLLTLIKLNTFVIVVLRPSLDSACWTRTYARRKQSRRYQPSLFHIVKYLTLNSYSVSLRPAVRHLSPNGCFNLRYILQYSQSIAVILSTKSLYIKLTIPS